MKGYINKIFSFFLWIILVFVVVTTNTIILEKKILFSFFPNYKPTMVIFSRQIILIVLSIIFLLTKNKFFKKFIIFFFYYYLSFIFYSFCFQLILLVGETNLFCTTNKMDEYFLRANIVFVTFIHTITLLLFFYILKNDFRVKIEHVIFFIVMLILQKILPYF
ncbi:MAG: hypothetical protein ABS44_04755 [Chryseobacterium sp. SCN 40-13]|nr:MAG: hypothetical protein ABS44_04755 [Chryseobacterium sp. SCN 40-13]